MRKRSLHFFVFVAALAGLGAVAGQWLTLWRFQESTDDAYVKTDTTPISPKVAGHVVSLNVSDNQWVEAGAVLLRLDPTDYQAQVDAARAQVAARHAALVNLDQRLSLQQSQIARAGADVSAAEAGLSLARADLARTSRLVQEDFASRQRFDTQAAEARKAEASRLASSAQLQAAKRQTAVLESERAITAAQLAEAEAVLRAAEADLANTEIRSPVAGVVGSRAVQNGQFVRPGAQMMVVVPLDRVWVDANFKETQIGRMQPGQPVRLEVDAFPEAEIPGVVDSLSPASGAEFSLLPPENATGNFTKVVQRIPVKIALPKDHDLSGRLRPGMSVIVTVDTRGKAG